MDVERTRDERARYERARRNVDLTRSRLIQWRTRRRRLAKDLNDASYTFGLYAKTRTQLKLKGLFRDWREHLVDRQDQILRDRCQDSSTPEPRERSYDDILHDSDSFRRYCV